MRKIKNSYTEILKSYGYHDIYIDTPKVYREEDSGDIELLNTQRNLYFWFGDG